MVEALMQSGKFGQYLPTLWIICLAFLGGASRYDEWQQLALMPASMIVLVAALWTPTRSEWRAKRPLVILALVIVVAIAVQIVPLPPAIWQSLPGRASYATVAELSGRVTGWRPISMTPDLTWACLFSLLPLIATLAVAPIASSSALPPTLWTVAGLLVINVLFGLLQVSGADSLRLFHITNDESAVGLFANRNHYAVALVLIFPVITLLTLRGIQGSKGPAWAILPAAGTTLLVITAIVQAGSRAGLVLGALMLGAILTLCWTGVFRLDAFRRVRRRGGETFFKSRYSLYASGFVVVGLASFLIVATANSTAYQRLVMFDIHYDYRSQLFPTLRSMISAFFPWGSGYGSFATVYREFEPFESLRYTYLNQAHNDLLQAIVEGGLVAIILIVITATGWGVRTYYIFKESMSEERSVAIVGCLMTLTLFLASLVDYPLRTPLMDGLLIMSAVLMLRSPERRLRSEGPSVDEA
jgi:O-antigen ligase